jgi:hypothetical protein
MALMSALGRMVKLIIEIVKKSDMNSVKHNYFGGEKNKFCRIKENEKEHLNEYLTFSGLYGNKRLWAFFLNIFRHNR